MAQIYNPTHENLNHANNRCFDSVLQLRLHWNTAAERAVLVDPGVYSRFIETDSGNEYRWGGGAWQELQAAGISSVSTTGAGINIAASVDANNAITANVDAAVPASSGLRLVGFAARESAVVAVAATFMIINGATGATDSVVVPVELAAGASTMGYFGPDGIACIAGISIRMVAGTADVSLFYKIVA